MILPDYLDEAEKREKASDIPLLLAIVRRQAEALTGSVFENHARDMARNARADVERMIREREKG